MSGEHILVIEDDAAILAGLEAKLALEGFLVSAARDGERARRLLEVASPDLLLLDLMLPGIDGLSLLRWLRQRDSRVPVLIISARGREEDKIAGLRAGADDYLSKPFGLGEMLARIDALLRRARGAVRTAALGQVTVDLDSGRVTRDGSEVPLSRTELNLLGCLLRRRGQVVSRDAILQNVWGTAPSADARAVDYHVLNLRKKLEEDPAQPRWILTRHGLGYEIVSE